MNCRWVETDKFDFEKETEFDCYIFMDKKILKANFNYGRFFFNYGFCGRKVPTHLMKITIPKEPKLSFENE